MIGRFTLAFVIALATLSAPRAAQARRCPNIMFVVDRSGSMANDPNGGFAKPSKWDLLSTAITAVVQKYGNRLLFGLEMFTSGQNQACNNTKIDVLPAHGTGQTIIDTLAANNPDGGTNTGEAIKRAYTDGMLNDKSRGNYIVLITDGDPNCNANEPQYTVSEIKNAAMMQPPIHTFVVGFDGAGGGVNPKNLNDMAKAGLEPIAGCDAGKLPCYYSASTTQKFLDAIDRIIGGLAGGTVIGGCDDSCFGNGCPDGQQCVIPMQGADPVCQPNACAMVQCDKSAYCKDGQCQMPCAPCMPSEHCVAGKCVNDPCANVQCAQAHVCNPQNGGCVPDKCLGNHPFCPLPTFCDPATGTCADDPCRLVDCPANATCDNGWCMIDPPPPPPPDMAAEPEGDASMYHVWFPDLASGGGNRGGSGQSPGGCTVGTRAPDGGALPLSLLLAAIVTRRRRARCPNPRDPRGTIF